MTLHTPPAFDALLVAAPPKVSAEQAQAVAARYFGLHGACRLLSGEVRYDIEWPGVSAEEKDEGWILPCVAKPCSNVVIEQNAASAQ